MGLMINLDCDVFYHSRRNVPNLICEDYVREYINQYMKTSATDIVLNVGGLLSSTPSCVRATYLDRAKYAAEHNLDWGCAPVVLKLDELGIDVYKVWVSRLFENGLNPWLSFRMNDAHNLLDDTPLTSPQLRSMFEKCSVIRHHRQFGWYDRCQDYSLEEIRRYHLDYIEEQTMQYLPYGIELDFQRELSCFRPGHEWSGMEVMTDFMKDVKEIVTRAEKAAGRKIKISVRCNQSPQYCMEWGFDIIEWARLGLIDSFAPAPRWNSSDTDIPVKLWKRILAPYNIPVYPGIDVQNIHPHPDDFMKKGHTVCCTVETVFAMASNFLTQGADGIYLFNFFNEIPEEMGKGKISPDCNDIFKADGYYTVLMLAGNYDDSIKQNRRHMITYNDRVPLYRENDAVLPLVVGGEYNQGFHSNGECNPRYLRFATGTVPSGRTCKLRFRIPDEDFDVNNVEIFINCHRADFIGTEEQGEPYFGISPVYGESKTQKTPLVYVFGIPTDAIEPEIQVAEILLKEGKENKSFTIDYADLIVK